MLHLCETDFVLYPAAHLLHLHLVPVPALVGGGQAVEDARHVLVRLDRGVEHRDTQFSSQLLTFTPARYHPYPVYFFTPLPHQNEPLTQ